MVTYRQAGVDIATADGWLDRVRPLVRSTKRPGLLADQGQFAGLFRLKALGCQDPILVASTDGVGTKLLLARTPRELEAIGVDVVAMNTNDVLVYGAQPVLFLDYLAVGKIQPPLMTSVLRGIAHGCRLSGCALLGGETAEMPGLYQKGEYDVAGFCVGVVERAQLLDGSKVRSEDVIIGLASSGVHANGFSLVRKALTASQTNRLRRQLLLPTKIYVKPVLEALRRVSIHAIAHITGGGLARRIPSLVSAHAGLRAHLRFGSWPIPTIFRTIQEAGRIAADEMMSTFNMGIGMALVCRPRDAQRVQRLMARARLNAWPIGTIVEA